MAEKKSEKKVVVHLFKDNGKYSSDFTVGIGGKIWKIKRGVDVEVPENVAKRIEKSLRRRDEADSYVLKKSKEAEKVN